MPCRYYCKRNYKSYSSIYMVVGAVYTTKIWFIQWVNVNDSLSMTDKPPLSTTVFVTVAALPSLLLLMQRNKIYSFLSWKNPVLSRLFWWVGHQSCTTETIIFNLNKLFHPQTSQAILLIYIQLRDMFIYINIALYILLLKLNRILQ